MKELINNLRLDAGISQLKDDPRLVVIDREGNVIDPLIGLEKFAELIVKECVKAADEWYQYHNEIQWDPGEHIKQHFGVDGMSTEDKKTLIKELLGVKND